MRTSILPLAALLFFGTPASTQLHAGEVPIGSSALDLDIDLVLSTSFTIDSASLELDCDDFQDAWAVLISGAPLIDAPNLALLRFVDDDMEVCADFGIATQQRPQYYAFDQLLACAGDFDWQPADDIVLGDFGGFTAIGPIAMDSVYIAYRRDASVGWMLLSFDVQGGLAPVRLQVHQVLPICPSTTSIAEHDRPDVSISPNPSNGEPIRVQSADALQSIEVLDVAGRSIAQYNGTVRTIPVPEVAGTYLVRVAHADGRRSTTRLVRN